MPLNRLPLRGALRGALYTLVFLSSLIARAVIASPLCPLDDPRFEDGGAPSLRREPEEKQDQADSAKKEEKADDETWYVNEPHGPCDTLRFEVKEGTWLSLDVHPNGQSLVFDLLGDLYTLPMAGGRATRLTSGPAWDFQPRWSRDGKSILFTSDRSGVENIWMMDASGGSLHPLTFEKDHETNSGALSPDGEYIAYKRRFTDGSPIGRTELWLSSVRGGSGLAVTSKDELPEVNEPIFSPDGRYIYYSARQGRFQYDRNVFQGIYQIQRFDRETGQTTPITDGYGGSGAPTLSPDGKSLAFVRRDRLTTVLYLFDLERMTERPIFDGLSEDLFESFAWAGVYPTMSFTPDGKAIVFWAKGKLWSLPIPPAGVVNGTPREIPFQTAVEIPVDHALRWPRAVSPDSMRVRMLSWPTQSPDGGNLVFAAIGSLWQAPLPGSSMKPGSRVAVRTPQKLATSGGLAYSPSYSRDGKWLAYVSWSDDAGGQIWKMPARGGASTALASIPSQYANPAFSPDGSKIAAIRGSNASFRGGDLGDEGFHDIVWIPSDRAKGGNEPPHYVITISARGSSRRMPRLFWNPAGDRVLYIETEFENNKEKESLRSVRLDGTDVRTLATWQGAEEVVPSPDARWVAYRLHHNAYVAELPMNGTKPVELGDADGAVPARQFTKDGGEWLNWANGGKTVTWAFGPEFYRTPLDTLLAAFARQQDDKAKAADPAERDRKKAEEEKKKAEAEKKKEAEKDKSIASDADSTKSDEAKADDAEKEEDASEIHPDTLVVRLELPRAKPQGTYGLVGARLITMKGDEVVENGTIVVKDNRIVAVGPRASTPVPAGARVFDVTGTTIMPGMIDTHAHLHYNAMDILPEEQWVNWCNLAYGVTTTHDPSASTYAVFTESEMIEAGVMHGPRTYSTGYILYGAEDPNNATVNSLEDARNHVRRLKRLGAFSVKSYMQPRREQRQWIIEAARDESVLVVPEGGGNLQINLSMVVDGHTSVEHALPVAPVYDDVAQLFGRSGTVETPTLLVAYGGLSGEHWFYQHYDVWKNEKLLRFFPRQRLDARSIRRPVMTMDGDWHHMRVAAGCKKILEAGGHISLGAHGQLQGLGPHWELWAMTQGGISNHDALRNATLTGAWELGMDKDLGSLETGKLADFVVLDKNPLEKIENSDSARYVVKNGEVWKAATMDQVWPVERPCHPFIWQALGGGHSSSPSRGVDDDQ